MLDFVNFHSAFLNKYIWKFYSFIQTSQKAKASLSQQLSTRALCRHMSFYSQLYAREQYGEHIWPPLTPLNNQGTQIKWGWHSAQVQRKAQTHACGAVARHLESSATRRQTWPSQNHKFSPYCFSWGHTQCSTLLNGTVSWIWMLSSSFWLIPTKWQV